MLLLLPNQFLLILTVIILASFTRVSELFQYMHISRVKRFQSFDLDLLVVDIPGKVTVFYKHFSFLVKQKVGFIEFLETYSIFFGHEVRMAIQ